MPFISLLIKIGSIYLIKQSVRLFFSNDKYYFILGKYRQETLPVYYINIFTLRPFKIYTGRYSINTVMYLFNLVCSMLHRI